MNLAEIRLAQHTRRTLSDGAALAGWDDPLGYRAEPNELERMGRRINALLNDALAFRS